MVGCAGVRQGPGCNYVGLLIMTDTLPLHYSALLWLTHKQRYSCKLYPQLSTKISSVSGVSMPIIVEMCLS